jgi:hypothetical protein
MEVVQVSLKVSPTTVSQCYYTAQCKSGGIGLPFLIQQSCPNKLGFTLVEGPMRACVVVLKLMILKPRVFHLK